MTHQPKLHRRDFLKITAASPVTLSLTSCYGNTSKPTPPRNKPPNIIFIIADDLGWADVGYHGSELKTPNINNLAQSGVHLDRHYVLPTCTPTRVGFLTGHYPSRYGVVSPAYGKIFNDNTLTIAEALRRRGYATHIIGKWHMGSPPDYTPLKYGFEKSYGYFHGQIDPYTHHYKTGVKSWHRNDQYLEETGHATDLITDAAVQAIENKEVKKPFFLYVAYSVPHFPLAEPDKYTDMYKHLEPESRRWYAASVTHMDDGIGRIVEAVDRNHLRDNTLIIFVSDNGGQKSWHSRDQYHGRYDKKPHTVLGENKPLRGWKGDLYEGGMRVPGLVNWPGVLKPGKMTAPMHIVDWMPTLCSVTGYKPKTDPGWDGMNVWPLLSGAQKDTAARTMYWKTPGGAAVRQGDWKLITDKKREKFELYQVTTDPYEKKNKAQTQPEKVKALRELLEEIARKDK